jgi:hypothetical protein
MPEGAQRVDGTDMGYENVESMVRVDVHLTD